MGRDTIRHYVRALSAAALLDGEADELPELDVLQCALAAQMPPRPTPQQSSTLEGWRELIAEMHDRRAGPRAIFDRLRLEQPRDPPLAAIAHLGVHEVGEVDHPARYDRGMFSASASGPQLTAPSGCGK